MLVPGALEQLPIPTVFSSKIIGMKQLFVAMKAGLGEPLVRGKGEVCLITRVQRIGPGKRRQRRGKRDEVRPRNKRISYSGNLGHPGLEANTTDSEK